MSDDESILYLSNGLGFEAQLSRTILDVLNKANCLLMGIAAGVGLSIMSTKDANKIGSSGHVAPSRKMNLALILTGLGVGTVAVGGVCKMLKTKLQTQLDIYGDASSAINALTPDLKRQLVADAQKLLNLKKNIDEMFEEERQSGYNPDLVA